MRAPTIGGNGARVHPAYGLGAPMRRVRDDSSDRLWASQWAQVPGGSGELGFLGQWLAPD